MRDEKNDSDFQAFEETPEQADSKNEEGFGDFDGVEEELQPAANEVTGEKAVNDQHEDKIEDPSDYPALAKDLSNDNSIRYETREMFSAKAFGHTAQYDVIIYNYMLILKRQRMNV